MNKYLLRTIKIASFCLAATAVLYVLQEYVLCHLDHNRLRIDGYYLEEENTLDGVFTGASEAYSDFSPGLAYEKFGFTSFPYASASATAGAAITQIKEIKRTQNPQLIVMEINPFLYPDDRNETKEGSIRNYIDNVPLNQNKIEYIKSLETADEAEYYLPFIKYHSSWSEYPGGIKFLGALVQQHIRGYTLLKGYKSNTGSCREDGSYLNDKLISDDSELPLTEDSDNKLRELLEYLNDNDIKNVLFIRAPHLVRRNDYESFCMANRAGKIINSYGFDFINFERDEITMSYPASEYYNVQHLNIYSSAKFTEYLGTILTERYGVHKSELNEKQTERWNQAVEYYHKLYRCIDALNQEGSQMLEIEEDLYGMRMMEPY